MEKNTGKVREKSGNFVSPEKWEPCENINAANTILLTKRDLAMCNGTTRAT